MKAERLLKLAEHLEHGKLGHDKFKINVISQKIIRNGSPVTYGCGIGELPFAFPEIFVHHFDDTGFWGSSRLNNVVEGSVFLNFDGNAAGLTPVGFYHAAEFFDIQRSDADFLFAPSLPVSTRFDLAAHIRQFVAQRLFAAALVDALPVEAPVQPPPIKPPSNPRSPRPAPAPEPNIELGELAEVHA